MGTITFQSINSGTYTIFDAGASYHAAPVEGGFQARSPLANGFARDH